MLRLRHGFRGLSASTADFDVDTGTGGEIADFGDGFLLAPDCPFSGLFAHPDSHLL
jgi:hypothetical protein